MPTSPNKSPKNGKKKPQTQKMDASENDISSRRNTGTEKSGAWSNEEIKTLVSMVKAATPVAEISKVLNRTAQAVKSQMSGLRVRSKLRGLAAAASVPRGSNALARDMLTLERNQCRWPCDGDKFCKAATPIGAPYCAEHAKKSLSGWVKPLNIKGLIALGR